MGTEERYPSGAAGVWDSASAIVMLASATVLPAADLPGCWPLAARRPTEARLCPSAEDSRSGVFWRTERRQCDGGRRSVKRASMNACQAKSQGRKPRSVRAELKVRLLELPPVAGWRIELVKTYKGAKKKDRRMRACTYAAMDRLAAESGLTSATSFAFCSAVF